MSYAEHMENRVNAECSFEECQGDCEAADKIGRLEQVTSGIADAESRGLHIPLSLSSEKAELEAWLKKNGDCTC